MRERAQEHMRRERGDCPWHHRHKHRHRHRHRHTNTDTDTNTDTETATATDRWSDTRHWSVHPHTGHFKSTLIRVPCTLTRGWLSPVPSSCPFATGPIEVTCVCACARASERACVRACVRAFEFVV